MGLYWVNPCKLLKLVSGTQLSSPKVLTNITSIIDVIIIIIIMVSTLSATHPVL